MSKTLKIALLVLAIVVIVGILVLAKNNIVSTNNSTIKIGLINTLTGSAAVPGEEMQKGYELAIDELYNKYGLDPFKISFVSEDSQSKQDVGISAYEKLKSVDHVNAVVTGLTPVSMAIASSKKNNEDGVIQLAVSTWGTSYRTGGLNNFRIDMTVETAGKKLVEHVKTKNFKRVAIISINNEFGVDFTSAFKTELKNETGLDLVGSESFLPTETDYRTIVTKIKKVNPDVIFIIPYSGRTAGTIIKTANDIGLKTNYISLSTVQDKDLIELAGKSADGLVYVFPLNNENKIGVDTLSQAYKTKYNKDPYNLYYVAVAYQSIKTLGLAFKDCDYKDNGCVQNKLANEKFNSIFGNLSFDKNHDATFLPILKTVKDSKFVELQ